MMFGRKRFISALLLAVTIASSALAQNTPSMNLEGSGLISLRNCSATLCDEQLSGSVSGVIGQSVQNLNFVLDVEVPVLPAAADGDSVIAKPLTLRKGSGPKIPSIDQEIQDLQSKVENLQSEVSALQSGGGAGLPPGCLPASGTGTTSDGVYSIGFEGWFCVFGPGSLPDDVETIYGWTAIEANALSPEFERPWASGTLVATGWPACCGGQYPILSNNIIVSIVGALGQEYEGPP